MQNAPPGRDGTAGRSLAVVWPGLPATSGVTYGNVKFVVMAVVAPNVPSATVLSVKPVKLPLRVYLAATAVSDEKTKGAGAMA